MAVNKNFVVKNGIEVATDLLVATADQNRVGIGSTFPQELLDVGGDFRVLGNSTVVGLATIQGTLNVGSGGTVITADESAGRIGLNTATPGHNVHISNVGSGNTALYVDGGEGRFTDGLTANTATITGETTLAGSGGITTTGGDLYVGGTLDGRDINVSGIATLGVVQVFNGEISASSGVVTYVGDGSQLTGVTATAGGSIGLGAEGTFVGAGVTQININSSSGSGVVGSPAVAGVATVTITSGVSIGLAIALGG